MMSTPWLPLDHADYPLARLANLPSIRMDFDEQPLLFTDADCETFGEDNVLIAARLCLTAPSKGRIEAGIFVCQDGLDGDGCRVTDSDRKYLPNITTKVQFFQLQATVIAARSNFSIVEVQPSESYTSVEVDLLAYKAALNWLLNFTAAGIPAPSSIVELFWADRNAMRDPAYYAILSQSFQSILAFPFWFFNANNYGNLDLQTETIITTLPPEFYTQVDIVKPYSMFNVDRIKAKSTFVPELGDMDQADDKEILEALSDRKAEQKLALAELQDIPLETIPGSQSRSQADAGLLRRVVAVRRGTL
ncbi:hypothetical protein E8E14_013576 [Neopestalotiopsis sp. 37M]|nr:hypothetical protein E8E14_013576 [Neopestalotiopsis sp. 37M]